MNDIKKINNYYTRTVNSKDYWETPQYFFNLLNSEFVFTLDPCSSEENHKCNKYYTEETNGLNKSWIGERVFVNPPFSNLKEWSEKCYKESLNGITTIVMILPTRSDTKYWHDYIMKAYEIRLCYGRVNFLLNGVKPKSSVNFPLSIAIFKAHNNPTPILTTYYHKGEIATKKLLERLKDDI